MKSLPVKVSSKCEEFSDIYQQEWNLLKAQYLSGAVTFIILRGKSLLWQQFCFQDKLDNISAAFIGKYYFLCKVLGYKIEEVAWIIVIMPTVNGHV